MTEHLSSNESNPALITSRFVDIDLGSRDELSRRLTQIDEKFQTYIKSSDEDNLPYPVRSVLLTSLYTDNADMPSIQGSLSFRPTDLENAPGTWGKPFLERLSEHLKRYDFTPHVLEHDPLSFYVTIDANYCVRISLGAEPNECWVTMATERIDTVEAATHQSLPVDSSEIKAPVDRLLHTATILSAGIDELRVTFGKPPKYSKQYSLTLASTASHKKDNTPSTELVIASPRQTTIPEVETVTAMHNGLSDVGGATTAKRRLLEIATILNDPQAAKEYGVQGGHFLLHGPSGTGKSSLANAFAQEVGANIWPLNSTDIVTKWVGGSGKKLADIFKRAKSAPGKLVLFIDEIDTIARKGNSGTNERIDVRKCLNLELEDIANNHPNIIVAAATNVDLDDLEPSLIRAGRFEPIGVPTPNERERLDIWGIVFLKSHAALNKDRLLMFDNEGNEVIDGQFSVYSNDIRLEELASLTHGLTGADFEAILEHARSKSFHYYQQTGNKKQVTHADIVQSIREYSR